jgi:hypothetical protein
MEQVVLVGDPAKPGPYMHVRQMQLRKRNDLRTEPSITLLLARTILDFCGGCTGRWHAPFVPLSEPEHLQQSEMRKRLLDQLVYTRGERRWHNDPQMPLRS